jgi:hypothetical protein
MADLLLKNPKGRSKRPVNEAAGSEDPFRLSPIAVWRATGTRYVEGFDGYPLLGFVQWVMRTKLGAFFSVRAVE